MNMITVRVILLILVVQGFGCSAESTGNTQAIKKVSEQQLSTYTTLRRISYRNTCGSEGLISVCVERITISDNAAMLEMRIINSSPESYVPGRDNPPSLLLTSSGGNVLKGRVVNLEQIPSSGEKYFYCKLDGNITGNPKELIIATILSEPLANERFYNKITVALGG